MLCVDCGESCEVIKLIQKQFLSGLNVKEIDWTELFKHLTELSYPNCIQHQDKLLDSTVGFKQINVYPLKPSYQLAFLKVLINKAEESDIAHPAIYDFYVSLLPKASENPSEIYRHFPIGERYIFVKESPNIISQGTTGLSTWQGGVFLADWSIQHSEVFKGKKVLELGSGVGLTGLALCFSEAAPAAFVFSDCHREVIKNLETNISLNVSGERDSIVQRINKTQIKIVDLNWERVDDLQIDSAYMPEVVIAAGYSMEKKPEVDSSLKSIVRNYRRRPGRLYKSVSNRNKVISKYFSNKKNRRDPRWVPPRSPYALVQEDLYSNPWQLLIATIFLTKTSAKKAIPQIHKFFARWPNPESLISASFDEVLEFFTPIGLEFLRTENVIKFSQEYLEKDWQYPIELHGIGKYGNDSYRMFCINEWREVSPDDIPLTMYRNWLLENAEELGV